MGQGEYEFLHNDLHKLTNERIAFEIAFVVVVQPDSGLVTLGTLSDHTELRENLVNLIFRDIIWK